MLEADSCRLNAGQRSFDSGQLDQSKTIIPIIGRNKTAANQKPLQLALWDFINIKENNDRAAFQCFKSSFCFGGLV